MASPEDEGPEAFGARFRADLFSRKWRSRLLAACAATALAPPILAAVATGSQQEDRAVTAAPATVAPVPAAPGDGPAWLLNARAAATTCPGLSPAVLFAIAQVETRLGRGHMRSPAGAAGPMQFLPATWDAYGTDGDGDGVADVMNPVDAMYGAARLLCANGAAEPAGLRAAVWNYNHSHDYVDHVLRIAGVAA
jgi:soluble lytic murein transglycosylase-like protein